MTEELDYKKIATPSIDGKTILGAEWAKNTIRLRFTDDTGFICHFADNGEPYLLNDDEGEKDV